MSSTAKKKITTEIIRQRNLAQYPNAAYDLFFRQDHFWEYVRKSYNEVFDDAEDFNNKFDNIFGGIFYDTFKIFWEEYFRKTFPIRFQSTWAEEFHERIKKRHFETWGDEFSEDESYEILEEYKVTFWRSEWAYFKREFELEFPKIEFSSELSWNISLQIGDEAVRSVSIYKLKGRKNYTVEIRYLDPDTAMIERFHYSTGETSLTKARKKEREIIKSFIAKYEKQSGKGITLGEHSDAYIKEIQNTKSHGHFKDTRQFCNGLTNMFGQGTSLTRILTKHINDYLLTIKTESRRAAARRVLHALFERALVNRYVQWNPVKGAMKFRSPDADEEFVSPNDFRQIYLSLPKDDYFQRTYSYCYVLALQSGLRLAEIVNLRERDITITDQVKSLTVANTSKHNTKSGKSRTILLTDEAIRFIQLQRENKEESQDDSIRKSQYLFPSNRTRTGSGIVYSRSVSEFWIEHAKKVFSDRNIKFKSLRHSNGQQLLHNTIFVGIITKLLGHSSTAVTEKHYAKTSLLNVQTEALRSQLTSALATHSLKQVTIPNERITTALSLEEILAKEGITTGGKEHV